MERFGENLWNTAVFVSLPAPLQKNWASRESIKIVQVNYYSLSYQLLKFFSCPFKESSEKSVVDIADTGGFFTTYLPFFKILRKLQLTF